MLGKLEKICQTRQEEEGGEGPALERSRTTRECSVTDFDGAYGFLNCVNVVVGV